MAGLLDYYFDPQTYGGGLLNMPNVPLSMGGGFGGQDMSARAAPMAGAGAGVQAPAVPAQNAQPNFLSGISGGLANNSNMLLAMGAGLLSGEGFGGGLKNALVGSKLDRENINRGAATQALIQSGVPANVAPLVASNPALLASVLKNKMGLGGSSSDITEYEYAKRQGYKGSLVDWMANKRAGAGEYGLQGIPLVGPDGKPALGQLGKSGTATLSKFPEGYNVSKKPIEIDAGTETILLDPITRNPIGRVPKNIAGKKEQEAFGKGRGEAKLILPQTKTAVDSAFRAIESLRNHPGIDIGTGLSSRIDPRSWVPGQPGYDFNALNKQAMGKAFMAAREALKGAGQVTDFEGTKGEQAISNLDTAQSKEQYLKALDELEAMIRASYADLQKKAGVSSSAAPTVPTAPRPGGSPNIDDLVKKYGG